MAPQATRLKINDLNAAIAGGDFQAQIEFSADHHRQLTDQHQPFIGHVAQKADGFVSDAVEHS